MGVLSWIEKYNYKFKFKHFGRIKLDRVLRALYVVGKNCTQPLRRLEVSPAAR